jgi:hypothetical protein
MVEPGSELVMPAWIAGIQARMRPETSLSIWIAALHAGMTERSFSTRTGEFIQDAQRFQRQLTGIFPALQFARE